MRYTRLLLPLIWTCMCLPAFAADWVLIDGPKADGSWLYYDADGIMISAQIRRAWLKINYKPHTEHGNEAHPDKFLKALAYEAAFNCGEGTRRIEVYTGYYEDGSVETEGP